MFQQHEAYRKATCLFLATLEHEPCIAGKTTPTAVTGTSHSGPLDGDTISHTERSTELFSAARQPSRPRRRPRRDVRTLGDDRVWGVLLLKCEVRSDQEPAGPLLPQGDRQHALFPTGHRERHRDRDGHDRRGTHRHPVETDQRDPAPRQQVPRRHHGRPCSQLRSYRDWASRNRTIRHKCTLRMGGLVTPLLRAVGFTPDREDEVAPPERLDLEYLRNSVFLQKTSDASRLLYQFTHVQLGASRMLLPSPSWTTIRGGSNVEFNPPQSALYTGDRRPLETTPHLSHTSLTTTQTDELEHLHFAGYATTARQTAGLKAAHQHIGILQRWNKAQDKITSKLKSKVKKMADQIRAMQDKLSCVASASGGVHRTAVGPRQAIPSEDDDEPHHDTTGGRPLPPEPPRHSSFEPRQQRKRRFGEPQTARPSGAGAEQTCHSGDAAPLRGRQRRQIHTPPTRAPPDQYVPYTTSELRLPPSLLTRRRACRRISTTSSTDAADALS
ncbi:unnamed protein product [Microthlaspi erraticum]|uniref:Arabidopsis retrotransposon Orf1 C-terminal domain-containing protein n=1 Tax=Microthlaspi erraticum TaxID=1685480 RepID=A0A6D2HYL9_9BRAS|nr:unnamed protein product [Microthlaspi erraticum]